MHLRAGEFLGVRVRTRVAGGFTLTQYDYPAGADLPEHEHEHAYLSFPLSGGYEEKLGRTTRECVAGRGVFHPPGERHADRFTAGISTIFSVEIEPSWIERLRDLQFAIGERIDLTGQRLLRGARRLMHLEDPLRIEAAAIELLAELPSSSRETRVPQWMRRVYDCLDASTQRRPSLAELAKIAGVHPVHVARTFRQTTGCTISEFIRAQRIDRAMKLLRDGSRSLADVALQCGFADQSHFSRDFKRVVGVTPAGFVKSIQ